MDHPDCLVELSPCSHQAPACGSIWSLIASDEQLLLHEEQERKDYVP
jgi:hypothetical protein